MIGATNLLPLIALSATPALNISRTTDQFSTSGYPLTRYRLLCASARSSRQMGYAGLKANTLARDEPSVAKILLKDNISLRHG